LEARASKATVAERRVIFSIYPSPLALKHQIHFSSPAGGFDGGEGKGIYGCADLHDRLEDVRERRSIRKRGTHAMKTERTILFLVLLLLGLSLGHCARAWDSEELFNDWGAREKLGLPRDFESTHTRFTKWALRHVTQPEEMLREMRQHEREILDGGNTEAHGLPLNAAAEKKIRREYGIDLADVIARHLEKEEEPDAPADWWADSLGAYSAGDVKMAYYYLGVLLHMIQDIGLPSRANAAFHSRRMSDLDNFEYMAMFNWKIAEPWKPLRDDVNKADPDYSSPASYYSFNYKWTLEDAPSYDNGRMPLTWDKADEPTKDLLFHRQARTAHANLWALESALRGFREIRKH